VLARGSASRPAGGFLRRWSEFERGLPAEPLRAYLERLSDFADVQKEEEDSRAHPDVHAALGFMTTWPDLCRAGALVRARLDAIHGNCYWTLTPAAEGLENKEPPAFPAHRRMIDFILDRGRSKRHGQATRARRRPGVRFAADRPAGVKSIPTSTLTGPGIDVRLTSIYRSRILETPYDFSRASSCSAQPRFERDFASSIGPFNQY
jgi:Family of unknown function (DUF6880)